MEQDQVKNGFAYLYGHIEEKGKVSIDNFSADELDKIKALISIDTKEFSKNYVEDPLAIARIFLNLEAQLRGKKYLLKDNKLPEKITNTVNYFNTKLNSEFSLNKLVFEATRDIDFGRHRYITKINDAINECRNELLGFIEMFITRKTAEDLDLSDLESDLQEDTGTEEKKEKDDS